MTGATRSVVRAFAPLALFALAAAAVALVTDRSATRLTLELSWAPPSRGRPLGSTEGGVDLLGVVPLAALRALGLAIGVSVAGALVGAPAGVLAALRGGAVERATLRAADLVQAFPTFLLALAVLSAVRAPARLHVGAVFLVGAWAPFARLALVQTRAIAGAPFVEAARALGLSGGRVLTRHLLPNVFSPVAVQLGASAAGVVVGETALGFVGLGPRDGISLGALLEQGSAGMLVAPHVLVVASAAVVALVASLQLASEGLRRWALREGGA